MGLGGRSGLSMKRGICRELYRPNFLPAFEPVKELIFDNARALFVEAAPRELFSSSQRKLGSQCVTTARRWRGTGREILIFIRMTSGIPSHAPLQGRGTACNAVEGP